MKNILSLNDYIECDLTDHVTQDFNIRDPNKDVIMLEQELRSIDTLEDGIQLIESKINEGLFARLVGGLTGLALGKTIGKFLVRILQIQESTVLYKIFTSKLFYMAIGAAIGKGSPNKKHQRPK